MNNSKVKIICTRAIDQPLVDQAAADGIEIVTIPFIKIEPLNTEAVISGVEMAAKQKSPVIFTSRHAVETVISILNGYKPDWKIFCISPATSELVKTYFGEEQIAATAHYGSILARAIIESGVKEVIFFSGDIRRDEIPALLSKAGIHLTEITVYRTLETPVALNTAFDGSALFSPSAAKSFFSAGNDPLISTYFAIGKTTADAISSFSGKEVICSAKPLASDLIQTIIQFYKNRETRSVS